MADINISNKNGNEIKFPLMGKIVLSVEAVPVTPYEDMIKDYWNRRMGQASAKMWELVQKSAP